MKTIEAPAFDRIDAARAVKVVITDKTSGKIIIAADDNVMGLRRSRNPTANRSSPRRSRSNNIQNADVTA